MRKTRSFINKGFKPIKYKLTNLHFMTINQALKFISNKKLKKTQHWLFKAEFLIKGKINCHDTSHINTDDK